MDSSLQNSARKQIDRMKECDRNSSEMCKKARKRSRAVRKGVVDKDAEKEVDVYVPGGF